MGAMITIIYDSGRVRESETQSLSVSMKKIVEEAISDSDVFVYAHAPQSVLGADPIEVFVQVNSKKVADTQMVINTITESLRAWKSESNFSTPININLIPVEWFSEIQI